MLKLLLFIALLPLFLLLLLRIFYKLSFNYWKNRGVPSVPVSTFPWGSVSSLLDRSSHNLGVQLQQFYRYFKARGEKHGGAYIFARPIYIPIDPTLLKHVMAKDFDHFTAKGLYINDRDQPIGAHMFQVGGERWRKLRTKLSPTFTSGKMKAMHETVLACAGPLKEAISALHDSDEEIDIKDLCANYTTDVIGSCAFGLECNSFKNSDVEFSRYGKKIFKSTVARAIKRPLMMAIPGICRFFRLVFWERDLEAFYTNIVTQTVNYRESNGVERRDFLQLLIELKNKENVEERLSMVEIIQQSFLFFAAGFETSSSTMSYCLFELAQHVHLQDKVREEICRVMDQHGGKITYEAVWEMKYLQQVVDETLRKYPPLPILNRQCTKTYKVPGSDVVIEKDTLVFIPVYAIHHDPEIYPMPEKFDPERFSDEGVKSRNPYTFLPFGEGHRICIGLRFGYLEVKIGLAVLLSQFRFGLSSRTQLPLEFSHGLILGSKSDIYLTCKRM